MSFILEKTKSSKNLNKKIREGINNCTGIEYENIEELVNDLIKETDFRGFYIPKMMLVEFPKSPKNSLPFEIKKLPLICDYDLKYKVGNIKYVN